MGERGEKKGKGEGRREEGKKKEGLLILVDLFKWNGGRGGRGIFFYFLPWFFVVEIAKKIIKKISGIFSLSDVKRSKEKKNRFLTFCCYS